jgi:hypothetical protein
MYLTTWSRILLEKQVVAQLVKKFPVRTRRFIITVFKRIRHCPHPPHTFSKSRADLGPTQPPIQWVPGVLSPGVVKRSGLEADYPPPSIVKAKNACSFTLTPAYFSN